MKQEAIRLTGLTMYNVADYLLRSPGSKWFDMYLCYINPNLVVVERIQLALILLLEKRVLDVSRLKLRHSKKPRGRYCCVTLDIRRSGSFLRYSD